MPARYSLFTNDPSTIMQIPGRRPRQQRPTAAPAPARKFNRTFNCLAGFGGTDRALEAGDDGAQRAPSLIRVRAPAGGMDAIVNE